MLMFGYEQVSVAYDPLMKGLTSITNMQKWEVLRVSTYGSYRSRGATNTQGDQYGFYEDLKYYVGLGFLVDNNDHNTLVTEDKAIFRWDEEDLVHIAKWKKNEETSMVKKKWILHVMHWKWCWDCAHPL